MIEIGGYLYDGQTSHRQDALIWAYRDGSLFLHSGGEQTRFAFSDILVSERIGHTPRRLTLPDGKFFETRDNAAVDELIRLFGTYGWQARVHRLETNLPLTAGLTVVAVMAAWLFLAYGLPWVARETAYALPAGLLDNLSEHTLELLDLHMLQPSKLEAGVQARYQLHYESMTAALQGQRFRLLFRAGGGVIGANAFALPSGTVVVTDELVHLAKQDAEVVGILAHELGHVVNRHSMRQILQGSLLTLGAVLLTGDPSSIVALLPATLLELGYSREFEREADDYALAFLERSGFPTESYTTMLQRLEKEHSKRRETEHSTHSTTHWSYYLSTHPPTPERIARLRDPVSE
jgi:Zn-dependent protease with chaperone function